MVEVSPVLIVTGSAIGPAVISGGWLVTTLFTVINIVSLSIKSPSLAVRITLYMPSPS